MNANTTRETRAARFAAIAHDDQCERRPGGAYDGKTIGGGSDGRSVREPMPVPCHCPARAYGRRLAERQRS